MIFRFFFFALLLSTYNLNSQIDVKKYLDENTHKITYTNFVSDTNKYLDNYRVFFTGEYHIHKGNSKIEIAMIIYLYSRLGLRKLVLELPVSYEEFINAYILRGKRDSLNLFKPKIWGFTYQFESVINFLSDFNKSNKEKISAVCIDTEEDFAFSVQALQSLIRKENRSIGMEKNLNALSNLNSRISKKNEYEYFENAILQIQKDVLLNPIIYQKILLHNYDKFQRILQGLLISLQYDFQKKNRIGIEEIKISDSIYFNRRESFLFDNYIQVIKEFPLDIFYGQFGKAHVSTKLYEEDLYNSKWCSLAARLNNYESSPAKNLVCSIDIVYNINTMIRRIDYEGAKVHKKEIKKVIKGITLLKINEKNSPFKYYSQRYHFFVIRNK